MRTDQFLSKTLKYLIVVLLLSAQVYTKTALSESLPGSWQPVSFPVGGGDFQLIESHPNDTNILFAGRGASLYGSFDRGKNWKELFNSGPHTKINRLYFSPDGRMFLLTSDGLFESGNEGKNWKKTFQSGSPEERNVISLVWNENTFYLGTEGGLFESTDSGRTWQKDTNGFSRKQITTLQTDPQNHQLFIAAEDGLHRLTNKSLKCVYQTKGKIESDVLEIEPDEAEENLEEKASDEIHSIAIDPQSASLIAVGTGRGVFVSDDEGNHWDRLPLSGLEDPHILDLAYSPEKNLLFAATGKGVFAYDGKLKSWKALYKGLSDSEINKISFSNETLYAAGAKGLYQWMIDLPAQSEIKITENANWPLLLNLFQYEPSVRTVQKEAIHYANVSHLKTKKWQWASRMKALIPDLSVGKSYSKADSIDLDRGGSADPDRYIVGPRDTSQNWDFDLNWKLSELLFNTSQTSIDSREKSMVELRDDILSEITRLYFERRRAQVEFVLNPPEDPLEHTSSLLRIEELTASIDSLTNGFMSRELEKIYSTRPEFKGLWNLQTK